MKQNLLAMCCAQVNEWGTAIGSVGGMLAISSALAPSVVVCESMVSILGAPPFNGRRIYLSSNRKIPVTSPHAHRMDMSSTWRNFLLPSLLSALCPMEATQ